MEQAIRQLPSVYAVRVALDETTGELFAIHVMTTPGRNPKKVVRDIETLCMVKFSYRVDYRKISLVQAMPDELSPFLRARLRLITVEERTSDDGHRVMVSLADDTSTYLGIAEGDPDAQPLCLAARATLDALSSLLSSVTFKQPDIEVVPIQGQSVLLLVLTLNDNRGEQQLLGSSFINANPLTAAARATLDAVNRRLFISA